MPTARQLDGAAHHEAGHAVASFYLDLRFKYVTIVGDAEAWGHIRNRKVQWWDQHGTFDTSVRGADRAERAIMSLYAGQLADRKLYPHGRWRIGGSSDSLVASELFWRICDEDAKARQLYANLLWRRSQVLIDLHWGNIQAVAQELLARKRLSHADVVETIHSANGMRGQNG